MLAKAYTKTYGIDYQETFAHVVKMNTLRILISLAALFKWELQKFVVKNAFLHRNLKEGVFMEWPPEFEESFGKNKVCRLKKALGSNNLLRWFGRFAEITRRMGHRQSLRDHTLFTKHSKEGKLKALPVYVDDIKITRDDKVEKKRLMEQLVKEYEIKDLNAG